MSLLTKADRAQTREYAATYPEGCIDPDEAVEAMDTIDALCAMLRKMSGKCGPAWCAMAGECDKRDDCPLSALLAEVD
ncbi:hypothetical protein LCGC14_2326210 [marine sediment metagenome]|uniref:Uncharacterized protein n=1 Tax=marine sediment metagenome TaxID=412755 RepID=A0A0F9D3V8_9ZZZZ